MELSIDTSTNIVSLVLSQEGEAVAELSWHSRQNHTVELMPNLVSLLKQTKTTLSSLSAIFIARGPGSYNGLRVGMSTAKGLAFALNLPLISISTLEIEAFPFAYTGLPLCPIHNAGRGEIVAAIYQQKQGWHCLIAEHITTVDALIRQIKEPTLFCGEIPSEVVPQLQQELGKQAIIPEAMVRQRRAAYLAALGWQRYQNSDYDNPATLQPLYLRQPPITQPKKGGRKIPMTDIV